MRHAVLSISAVFVATSLMSCQIPGYTFGGIIPPPKIKALYEPIDQPTLVLVDDPRGALPSPMLLNLIADQVAFDLKREEIVNEFVPVSRLESLRGRDPDFATWAIDRVGRELGARQVIYVLIDSFDAAGTGQDSLRPMVSARVKVVDAVSGRRLFPERGELGVMGVLYREPEPIESPSNAGAQELQRNLAIRLGEEVGKKFYAHKEREVGSGFPE